MLAATPRGYVDAVTGEPPAREIYEVGADVGEILEGGETRSARVNYIQV